MHHRNENGGEFNMVKNTAISQTPCPVFSELVVYKQVLSQLHSTQHISHVKLG